MSSIEMPFSGTGPLVLFLAKATLLLVSALVATAWLRRSTAGARHLVWLAALVGVLALPVLSRIPALRVGVLPSVFGSATSPALAVDDVTRADLGLAETRPTRSEIARVTTEHSTVVINGVSGGVGVGVGRGVGSPAIAGAPTASSPSVPFAWSGYTILTTVAVVWGAIALALVGWLVAGALFVRRIVSQAHELTSPDWTMPLCEVADRLDLEIPPRLVMSDRIEMAFACRALAPTVVLPASAEEWTDDRRRAVLFHELAHVKRHDLLGHTLGRLACALYWFHPLVWTAAKRLRSESERACDDLVLSCGARPSEYAQHLLDMVTNVRDHGAPVMALPMARKKEFEGRMLAILDPAIRRASPGRLQAVAVTATLGLLSLTVAAVSPAAATSAPQHEQQPQVVATVGAEQPMFESVGKQMGAPRRSPSASPSPSPRPSPSLSSSTSTSIDIDTREIESAFKEGAKDKIVSAATNSLMKIVGNAIGQAGAQLAGRGRASAADTGRVALMIKILATDPDATVRRTAAWGLQDIESPEVRAALSSALHSDADDRVREMSAWALGEQGNTAAAAALSDAMLHDKNSRVRTTSAWALGEMDAKSEVPALESATADADPQVRELAIWALGEFGVHTAPKQIVTALTDSARQVRLIAAWALGEIEDKSAGPAIAAALKTETDGRVRSAEMRALAIMGLATSDILETALKSSDPEVRRRAVAMLAGGQSVEPWPWPRPQPRVSP
jgi:HEAT repeat protein/beta-lactamase regulating signal transducer with metallopeptidase domain